MQRNLHKLNGEDGCFSEVGDAFDVDQLLLLFTAVDNCVDQFHLHVQLCFHAVKNRQRAQLQQPAVWSRSNRRSYSTSSRVSTKTI